MNTRRPNHPCYTFVPINRTPLTSILALYINSFLNFLIGYCNPRRFVDAHEKNTNFDKPHPHSSIVTKVPYPWGRGGVIGLYKRTRLSQSRDSLELSHKFM